MGPRYKCFESSAPVGTWIVPKDRIEDCYNLDLTFRIDGKVVQSGNTSNLVFTIPRMLSEVSEYHALRTGDIICTGGPARPRRSRSAISSRPRWRASARSGTP